MKRFKKIYIEITNICNLKCSFCPPTKRQPKFIKTNEFEEILNKIKPYTDYIYLHVKGEPMLHPEFCEIIKIAEQKDFKINITTNGTFLKEFQNFILQESRIRQINISLHSHSKEEGIDDEEYLKNILNFAAKAKKQGEIYVALRLWNMEENNSLNMQNRKNKEILEKIEEFFKLDYKIEEVFIKGKGIKIADKIFLNFETKFEWPDIENTTDYQSGYCLGLVDQIGILADGTVVPCCLDENGVINLGNIFTRDLEEIISSEKAVKIIEGFKKREAVERLCAGCSFKNRF